MKRDYQFFCRRYSQMEGDFLEIIDYIDMKDDFEKPCYKIGSSKLMDFSLKVGTEIETLFRQILENKRFDSVPDITNKRKNQNIDIYREIIEPVYKLSDYELTVRIIEKSIKPFDKFNSQNPDWFQIYSRYKHDKIKLIEEWNLKHSLFALGGLSILVINHPSLEDAHMPFEISNIIFNTQLLSPRWALPMLRFR